MGSTDYVHHSRVRWLSTHVSVWRQVLHLEPDWGQYLWDCDVDGPGGHCNGDRQAETRIAEDCEGRSVVVVSNLQLDSSLNAMSCNVQFVAIQRGIVHLCSPKGSTRLSWMPRHIKPTPELASRWRVASSCPVRQRLVSVTQ